jgi:DNA-binding CsgD family transcriptional regulator
MSIVETQKIAPCCCQAEHLTLRELDVLCLVAAGSSTEQAASVLHMSSHTISHHLGEMLRRSGAVNRTELVARAYAAGILEATSWPPRRTGRFCLQLP